MDKSLTELSDEDLMSLVAKENHVAYTELVRRHTSKFYALAYRTLFDKVMAEDIVQDAFLRLWRDPHRWDSVQGVKFCTWFYKVILNLCLDNNKKKKPFRLEDGFDIQDESSNLEGGFHKLQKQNLIDRAIALLPESQRTALNLCFYERKSNQEAADIMGLKLKALQSLLIRAKNSLRENINLAVKKVG